jgi:hypothetical protein
MLKKIKKSSKSKKQNGLRDSKNLRGRMIKTVPGDRALLGIILEIVVIKYNIK